MKSPLLVLIFLLSNVNAARIPSAVEVIDASSHDILMYAPVLRDMNQAEAIRKALVNGVKVTILSEPEAVFESLSYIPALKLAGAAVFMARIPNGQNGLLIGDARVALTGLGIGRKTLPYEPGLKLEQTQNIPALQRWFSNALKTAKSYVVPIRR